MSGSRAGLAAVRRRFDWDGFPKTLRVVPRVLLLPFLVEVKGVALLFIPEKSLRKEEISFLFRRREVFFFAR